MKIHDVSTLFKRAGNDSAWLAICPGRLGVFLASIRFHSGRPRVEFCTFHPVQDVDSSDLDAICRQARIPNGRITTLLGAGEYQLLMVDAPNVPVGELKTAVRWRIKDMLSYHIDDAMVDVLQIPTDKFGSGRPQSIFAVAASNLIIQKRIALFEKAGLALSVIDIPEMAQRNIAALLEEPKEGLAMIAFGDIGCLLTFTAEGELYMSRRIEISTGQLLDANEDLRMQYRERLELEVQRSLDYFGRQFHFIPVRRLVIAVPDDTGLEQSLAASTGIPVERFNLAQVMDISAVPELERSDFASEALHALGAALRQERRVL